MIEVPQAFLAVVDEVGRAVLGRRDATGPALAERVARLSELYTRRREAIGAEAPAPDALAARLRFFLPRDLPKVAGPLDELHRARALPGRQRWRVLDLGAGLGAATLGAARVARERNAAGALEVRALDRHAEALRLMRALCERAERAGLVPVALETRASDLAGALPAGPFDLILLGFVLNEMGADAQARAELLAGLATRLADDGAIVVLEPALRHTSRALHAVRDRIVARSGPPRVFAPCLRGGGCPMLENERDWCHEELPLALPDPLPEIARAAGLRFERLTYSYLTLRRDDRTLRDAFDGVPGVPYRVVSDPLKSKGKLELFVCGAPGRPRLVHLDRHTLQRGQSLSNHARRGALLGISPGEPDARGRLRLGPDGEVTALP